MNNVIATIARKYNLKMVVLFGSVAKNRANQNSDIDIAISSFVPLILKKELELRHELQYLFKKEIDLVFLQNAGALLLGQIAKEGKLLFGKKKDFDAFRIYAIKSYLDFKPYFQLQEKANNYRLKHA